MQKGNLVKYRPGYFRIDGQRLSHRELRERIERQRSVATPKITRADSLEGLNLEVHNTRSSVERLDTQVSTLHQDVATLSMEASFRSIVFNLIRIYITIVNYLKTDRRPRWLPSFKRLPAP